MLRTLAALAALLPALALAQVTGASITAIETSDFPEGDDEIINIAECEGDFRSEFSIRWTITATDVTVTPQVDLRISDTANCPLRSDTNATALTASLGTFDGFSGTLTPPESAGSIVTALGLTCEDRRRISINVCAVVTNAGSNVTAAPLSTSIRYDGQIPSPPANVRTTPGDRALDVSWDASTNADHYRVEATPQGGGPTAVSSETTDTSKRITGLENGTVYDVGVVALSIGGNPSALSATVPGKPVEVDDFWRRYQNSPGPQEAGGCATGGSGAVALWSLLGLLPILLRRRRS
jgi:hypothetical protein